MLFPNPRLWELPYRSALRENDPENLGRLVSLAEQAIFARYEQLAGTSVQGLLEHDEIRAAVADLLAIKIYKLKFPALKTTGA